MAYPGQMCFGYLGPTNRKLRNVQEPLRDLRQLRQSAPAYVQGTLNLHQGAGSRTWQLEQEVAEAAIEQAMQAM